MLCEMVRIVNDLVDVPICIDSSTPEALEAAVPLAGGKVLINSVTAEQHSMDRLLPLVAAHGAAVIGMANDETGISMDPDERFAAAAKVVANAEKHGIASRRRDHRPARDADRCGAGRRHRDAPHDPADPRRARREPLVRRLEHLVRHAGAARDRRRLPHADDRRRHEHRDHEPAAPPGEEGDPGRRTCCSVTTSTAPSGSATIVRNWRRRPLDDHRGRREDRGHLPPERQDRSRARGHDAVQRRPLGRAADRIDLRRPRHLRQVQRAGPRGRGRAVAGRLPPPGRQARRRLAPVLPVPDQRAR